MTGHKIIRCIRVVSQHLRSSPHIVGENPECHDDAPSPQQTPGRNEIRRTANEDVPCIDEYDREQIPDRCNDGAPYS